MSQSKKYEFKVVQDGETWKAAIIRQVTSKKTQVSKSKKGFESEAAATEWATTELNVFLDKLKAKNAAKAAARKAK